MQQHKQSASAAAAPAAHAASATQNEAFGLLGCWRVILNSILDNRREIYLKIVYIVIIMSD